MIKLYLITGFLGAGKTTFLKNLIRQLSGQRVRVIVNEFGSEGIDGTLLRESGAQVEEINNGSIFCSCRLDQFEEVLEKVAAEPLDVILVEASGLSDPTHIERVLTQIRSSDRISYKGGICLVDAVNFRKVLATARVCRKQVSVSDLLLINKTDLVSCEALAAVAALVRQVKPDAVIRHTVYGQVEWPWLDGLRPLAQTDGAPAYHLKDVSLQKMRIVIRNEGTVSQLNYFLGMIIEDTHRVKGFACLAGGTVLVDCVGAKLQVTPYGGKVSHGNVLTAMAGAGMPMARRVQEAAAWYPELVETVSWDDTSEG